VTLGVAETNLDVDFGVIGSDVGDTIWIDTNGDGVRDPSESGIPNVGVQLVDSADGSSVSTVTDANGTYLFGSVLVGDNTVIVDAGSIPEGFSQAYSRDGNLDGRTDVAIDEQADRLDVDFGYQKAELPNTGLDTFRLLVAGVLLLIAGTFAIWLTRRRGPA
jgi:LPXTG-motif cell wall-anchored protein